MDRPERAIPAPATPLRLIPLGGLGQIGMNCLALRQGDEILVIDCGVQYPEGDYGVEVICPDFTWLLENRAHVCGLVITHGHEDHIGALPYLLSLLDVPLFAPEHAAALISERLVESPGITASIQVVVPGKSFTVGGFSLEAIAMTHSIVGAVALAITTQAGVIVHSGDFKFDAGPMDGQYADESRLLSLGDEGVELLLSDSTNVFAEGSSISEREVADVLQEVIAAQSQRVFVAMFASNVHRLIALGEIAQQTGRRLCLLGRSLVRHAELAQRLGYLTWPKSLLLPADNLASYPRAEVLILTGGTQAESGSALARIAEGAHRFVSLLPGDTVIFSSRVIPGNERAVSSMIDALLRKSAKVITARDAGVHASGHAYREEQRHLIRLLRPRRFLPVHGTLAHLVAHAALAAELGVKDTLVIENGQTAAVSDGRLVRGADVKTGIVPLGPDRCPLSVDVVQCRRELGRAGVVGVTLVKGAKSFGCRVQSLGFAFRDETGPARLAAEVERFLTERRPSKEAVLRADLQRMVRNWCAHHNGDRPGVLVALPTEMGEGTA